MVNFTPDPRHNQVAYLGENEGYKDVVKWLKQSKIFHAISCDPKIYEARIVQFWKTAVFRAPEHIVARVDDREVFITEDLVRKALKLQDDENDPFEFTSDFVKKGFREIGYEGDFIKTEVRKNQVIKEWRYILHIFISCFSHRLSGYDGCSFGWGGIMLTFCRGGKVNISGMIFDKMIHNARSKLKKRLLYPRFLTMMLDDQLKDLPTDSRLIKVRRMTSRVFADCTKVGEGCKGICKPLYKNMYPAQRWQTIEEMYKKTTEARKEEMTIATDSPQASRKRKGPTTPETKSDLSVIKQQRLDQEKQRDELVTDSGIRDKDLEVIGLRREVEILKKDMTQRDKEVHRLKKKLEYCDMSIENQRLAMRMQQGALKNMYKMITEMQVSIGLETEMKFGDMFVDCEGDEQEQEEPEETEETTTAAL